MEKVVCFLVGASAGIAWYRYFIIQTINKIPRTMCDYCQFEMQKRQIFRKKK